jgi:5-hydroxyisourate hydrolase
VSGLSTHVLDTARGRPAAGVAVRLEIDRGSGWVSVAHAATNDDGRVAQLLPEGASLELASYRLTFDTGGYHSAHGISGFFPEVAVVFTVRDPTRHHHVPLLLSPYGYSTYRGS